MSEDSPLPDWLGRQFLHATVVHLGLHWDAAALVRGPDVAEMTPDENLQAVEWSLRITAGMRRLLPRGTSGAAVDHHWRRVAYWVAASAIVRGRAPAFDDEPDDEPPAQAGRHRGPPPRGPRPGGGSVSVEVVERKGGRRVPR